MNAAPSDQNVIKLDLSSWETFLSDLYERDDRLERKQPGETYLPDEQVDAYVLSAHAEAMLSSEVDGDVWGTLEDLEETASTEQEAWAKISAFYLDRGCLLVKVTGTDDPEEWLLSAELAERLGLTK